MDDSDSELSGKESTAPRGLASERSVEVESSEFAVSGEFDARSRSIRREARLYDGAEAAVNPVDPDEGFERYRARDLERYLASAPLPLALFTLAITAMQTARLHDAVPPRDADLWKLSATLTCLLVLGGALATRLAWVRDHYDAIAAPMAGLVLTKLVVMPYVFVDPLAANAESYFCAFGVFIVTVGLRLRVAVASWTVVLACAVGASLLQFVALRPIDWLAVIYSVVAPSVVGLFVARKLDEKDRIAFEQERLLEAQSQQLHRLAHADALSGLANRREFDRRLALEWDRLLALGRPLSLVFVDLDHFKAFNDHYGHAAGDDALAAAGAAIGASTARSTDLAARYGGEEFVLLLPETDRAGAEVVASRVLEGIRALAIEHGSSPVRRWLTASVGVATAIPSPRATASELVEEADRALYAAKSLGRDRITFAGIRAS